MSLILCTVRLKYFGLISNADYENSDVNLLRRNMKTCAGQYFPPTTTSVLYNTPTQSNRSTMAPGQINLDVPEGSGVQVLPIQWRHQISFEKRQNRGEEDEDEYPTLDDVTLEAVPGIRNLANDLVLDGVFDIP